MDSISAFARFLTFLSSLFWNDWSKLTTAARKSNPFKFSEIINVDLWLLVVPCVHSYTKFNFIQPYGGPGYIEPSIHLDLYSLNYEGIQTKSGCIWRGSRQYAKIANSLG